MNSTGSWWQRRTSQRKSPPVEVLTDIQAMTEFLQGLPLEVKKVLELLQKLEELSKEFKVAESSLMEINLTTQAQVLDELLERYEFFQNDMDINGIRLKQIAHQLLKDAEKAGLQNLVKAKRKNPVWKNTEA